MGVHMFVRRCEFRYEWSWVWLSPKMNVINEKTGSTEVNNIGPLSFQPPTHVNLAAQSKSERLAQVRSSVRGNLVELLCPGQTGRVLPFQKVMLE